MVPHPVFRGSPAPTLGVEVELTVVDTATGLPSSAGPDIAAEANSAEARWSFTTDLFESTLEIVTGICTDVNEVAADLRAGWTRLRPSLARREVSVIAGSIHPYASDANMAMTSEPRSQFLDENVGWPMRRMFATGVHVHVGMPDGDTAVRTATNLARHIPMLIALSAASPFAAGADTALASARMNIFAGIPRSGVMPYTDSWHEWCELQSRLQIGDAMNGPRDFWWDVRLQPDLGTLEIRVFDSVPHSDHLLACVALAWCLAVKGSRHPVSPEVPSVISENRWRAIRYGREAIITTADGPRPLRTVAAETLDELDSIAEELKCGHHLRRARQLFEEPSLSDSWRSIGHERGLEAVLDAATVRW